MKWCGDPVVVKQIKIGDYLWYLPQDYFRCSKIVEYSNDTESWLAWDGHPLGSLSLERYILLSESEYFEIQRALDGNLLSKFKS